MSIHGTMWALKGIAGEFEGNTLPLLEAVMTIGRTDQNHIFIADPNVSRHHATLLMENGDIEIQDEKSHNGLLINEKKMESGSRIPLKHGDRIQIGPHGFIIERIDGPSQPSKAKNKKGWEFFRSDEKTKKIPISFFESRLWGAIRRGIGGIRWNRRTIMYASAGMILLLMIIASLSSKKNASKPKPVDTEVEIQSVVPALPATPLDDSELASLKAQAKAALQFHDYLAATELYEKIARVQPRDDYIKIQHEYAKKQLKGLIETHLENAKREYEKLNYERAIIEWKQVQALTARANPEIYKQTEEKIQNTEKEIQRRR